MKSLLRLWSLLAVAVLLGGCAGIGSRNAAHNQLTSAERRAGWRLLFDGHSLDGWRKHGKQQPPGNGWVVEDGVLKLVAKSHPGDIITLDQFTDYELKWEWRIFPKGNNGIKYLVKEGRNSPGPEYQMVDDSTQDAEKRCTASLYDILPPARNKNLKAPGEWNESRLIVRGNHVEHWLNGGKALEYQLESPELLAAIAQSKFRGSTEFNKKIKGHILLTDHQDEAWYRNIKIREF